MMVAAMEAATAAVVTAAGDNACVACAGGERECGGDVDGVDGVGGGDDEECGTNPKSRVAAHAP